MIKTRTYQNHELTNGVCSSCGKHSHEILIGDGRCIDCIKADRFYEETMQGIL